MEGWVPAIAPAVRCASFDNFPLPNLVKVLRYMSKLKKFTACTGTADVYLHCSVLDVTPRSPSISAKHWDLDCERILTLKGAVLRMFRPASPLIHSACRASNQERVASHAAMGGANSLFAVLAYSKSLNLQSPQVLSSC